MNVEFDGATLLYALGILFALGAFLYFVRDVVFGLSITVKAVSLFLAFLGALLVGLAVDRDRGALDRVAFAIAAIAYAVFLGYVVTRVGIDETGTFLLLAASAGLFVALGYGVQQREVAVTPRAAGYALLGLAAVGILLAGADVAAGGVTYTVELDETATVASPDGDVGDREAVPAEVRIGTLTASNGPVFRRPIDLPSVRGCLAGTDAPAEDVRVRYRPPEYERPGQLPGGGERSYGIEARMVLPTNRTEERTVAIERASDCQVTRSEPTLVLVFGEGDRP